MLPDVRHFLKEWEYQRGLTFSFMESVPTPFWECSPHPKYSPLCKQFRHMIWVTGLYDLALREGKTDLSRKKSNYNGGTGREELIAGLHRANKQFVDFLDTIKPTDSLETNFFGTTKSLREMLSIVSQHESIHHGLWSLYAAVAGFPTPKDWRSDWEL